MFLKNIFCYGVWIITPIILFITAYIGKRSLYILFLMITTVVSYSFYVDCQMMELIKEVHELKYPSGWLDTHRSIVIKTSIRSEAIMLFYNISIGVIVWVIFSLFFDNRKPMISFLKKSNFFYYLFAISLATILLGKFAYPYFPPMITTMIVLMPSLIIAIVLNLKERKKIAK